MKRKKQYKFLNIKLENISLVVTSIAFGMMLYATKIFELYEIKNLLMLALSGALIPLMYFGAKISRSMLKEVYLQEKR